MNDMLQWGLDIVRAVQGATESPLMTSLMKAISFLGTEYFFLIALPFVYWCIDAGKGARLGFVVFGTTFVNGTLKDLWAQPRPYNLDASVGKALEYTYGLPSFHAQGALTFWGTIAIWLKKPFGIILAILITLLVSYSRIYLGVHFPTDVFAGWGLGLLIVLGYYFLGERLEKAIAKLDLRFQIILVTVLALLGNALHMKDTSITGAFFGIGVAYALMRKHLSYSAKGKITQLAGRYGLGILVALAIYAGLKILLPKEGEAFYALCRFLRYALLGFWVGFGAPWFFIKLGLAEGKGKSPA